MSTNFQNLSEFSQRIISGHIKNPASRRYSDSYSAAANLASLTKSVLLSSIPDPEEYGYTVSAPVKTDSEKVLFTCDTFAQEFCAHHNNRRFLRMFTEWMQGLPFCSVPFMNYDIIQIGKGWGVPMSNEDEESTFVDIYWNSLGYAMQSLYMEHRPKGSRVLFCDYVAEKVERIEDAHRKRTQTK